MDAKEGHIFSMMPNRFAIFLSPTYENTQEEKKDKRINAIIEIKKCKLFALCLELCICVLVNILNGESIDDRTIL